MAVSLFPPAEIRDSNMVLYLSTISLLISHCLWVHPWFSWSRKDVGSPKSTSLLSTFHIGSTFCFLPANLMSSTYTDENNPFSRCTNKQTQLETFSQPYFDRTSSDCLSHNYPASGCPYRFRSRGTTGSSILDHDFGHLCRGRRIQMSGHSDFGILNNLWSIFHFYLVILHQLLVPRTLAVWIWYPWLLLLSFVMLMILVRWILHRIQNRLLQYHLGVQLDLCIFGALFPIQLSLNDICPSLRQNELLHPSSLLHRSLLSYFWLSSGSTPKSFPIFPIPCPLPPLLQDFHDLEHRNKFVKQTEILQWVVPFSCNMVFMMIR